MLHLVLIAALSAAAPTANGELQAAIAAEEAGDLALARTHLEAAVKLAPAMGIAQVELAEVLLELGDEGPALKSALEAAEARVPQNPRLWRLQGAYAEDQGDAAGAIRAYEKALTLSDGELRTRFRLAVLYTGAGRADDAIAQYRRVLAVEPADRGARLALADLLVGKGDLAGAEVELGALVQAVPTNAIFKDKLHEVRVKRGEEEPVDTAKKMRPLRKSKH